MKIHLYIAWRYLFARKSHNVINVISAISAIGIAIGTAALVLILSIYNGFDRIIEDNMSDLDPDFFVSHAASRYFEAGDDLFEILEGVDGVESVSGILQENVFASYNGKQNIATLKGVDFTYDSSSPIASHITEGEFKRYHGDIPQASVGAGLAYNLGIRVRFLDKLDLYYPDGSGKASLFGPAVSMSHISLRPGSIFSISSDVDDNLVIAPLEEARTLLGKGDDVYSGIEVRVAESRNTVQMKKELGSRLGEDFTVRSRKELNPSLYKMMRYEKLAIYLILIFVVIIVAFNIFGSMSMLIIEKDRDMGSLRAMGATGGTIRKIFLYEGWLISLMGMTAGLLAGITASLVQEHFGIVKMPGNFFIESYPVVLQWADVLLTAAGVALIGFFISLIAARKAE